MRMVPGGSDVDIQLSPVLDLLSRSLEGERRVASVVEAALRAAGGSWQATVTPSAALEHWWVVRIARRGTGGAARSLVFDDRWPAPDSQFVQAITEIATVDAPARALLAEPPPRRATETPDRH